MRKSTALVLIYNHAHSANVEKLENVYRGRFSHIFHLMPFGGGGGGGGANTIPVYEGSFFFQGHIVQGYDRYFAKEHRHYIFVADDLLLNPLVNEENYMEYFGLDDESCFIPSFSPLSRRIHWDWMQREVEALEWSPHKAGIKRLKESLPSSYDEDLKRIEQLGLTIEPSPKYSIRQRGLFLWRLISGDGKFIYFKLLVRGRAYRPPLPFVSGYSDICIVSSKHIRKFVHYCGFFAASNLFVEIALPTALALCANLAEIVTQKELPFRRTCMWHKHECESFAQTYGNDLQALLTNFPEDTLYIHPVKLSQWK